MKIQDWYKDHFELQLKGRYVTLQHIFPLLDMYTDVFEVSVPGVSEKGNDIPLIKVGKGNKKVLIWSQMHGNESTTTKTLFDFLKFLSQKTHYQKEINEFLNSFTLYIVPLLNPDGAQLYTRENANEVDLNRDATKNSQKETMLLRKIFEEIQPDLCLNMHDQRSIYGLNNQKPAVISFLAPAANKKKSETDSRKVAMEHIIRMYKSLQNHISERVGRYDDTYNPNCVGDFFQNKGVATILFEAGHFKNDYKREKPREFVFYALLELFNILNYAKTSSDYKEYYDIPENQKNFLDIILRNVKVEEGESTTIGIQFVENFNKGAIEMDPVIDSIGDLSNFKGHKEIDLKGHEVLINSQKRIRVGMKIIKIYDKNDDLEINL